MLNVHGAWYLLHGCGAYGSMPVMVVRFSLFSNTYDFAQRGGLSAEFIDPPTDLIGTFFSNHGLFSQPASVRPCTAHFPLWRHWQSEGRPLCENHKNAHFRILGLLLYSPHL